MGNELSARFFELGVVKTAARWMGGFTYLGEAAKMIIDYIERQEPLVDHG